MWLMVSQDYLDFHASLQGDSLTALSHTMHLVMVHLPTKVGLYSVIQQAKFLYLLCVRYSR
jgi:hypothetical protein